LNGLGKKEGEIGKTDGEEASTSAGPFKTSGEEKSLRTFGAQRKKGLGLGIGEKTLETFDRQVWKRGSGTIERESNRSITRVWNL